MRELGQGIDVERMLKQERYARDVLLVCDACRDSELARLAGEYRLAAVPMPALAPATAPATGHAVQPMEWSRDTSGFGMGDDHPDAQARRAPSQADTPASWWQRLLPR
jgi:hypothetical protein